MATVQYIFTADHFVGMTTPLQTTFMSAPLQMRHEAFSDSALIYIGASLFLSSFISMHLRSQTSQSPLYIVFT